MINDENWYYYYYSEENDDQYNDSIDMIVMKW